ncbi:hypothetical protein [Mesomycoplasma dispar]|uniref:DUF2726 domain-containing protein n=1 Tax=Mesomycoplasma dispar TaxID=86660 RepID=A0ABN5DZD5_9BACT|nr:hypothetical protein [Mesomycoplasma dispar]ATP59567.1 hypothetical protein CSW10_01205 [Mesomycoplasma dispar]
MIISTETYLIIFLIILISIFFLVFLIAALVFAFNKKTKTTTVIPLTYDPELKRIRVSDVFSLPSLKYIIKNKNLLSGLWITQDDFVALLEKPYQQIFLSSLKNWKKKTIWIKFHKRFLFNNHFQVFFQAKPKNGFVIQEVQKTILDTKRNKKIFKDRVVDKLILNFEHPSFLVAFSFPFQISTDFVKNFFIFYNKKILFFKKISNFSILHFDNILVMQICAKSAKLLEKIKNYYKYYAKNHNLGNFLFWTIINLDRKVNYDWKIEIHKFFDFIVNRKTNFLEIKSDDKNFKQIIENNSLKPFIFNVNDYKYAEIYQFSTNQLAYEIYNFDFYHSQKIEQLIRFFAANSNFDHSKKIYKINYIIAQKMRNLPIDFQKFIFLIESEINSPDADISYINNVCFQKTVDSKLFYYLDIEKPPILFIEDRINFSDVNESNDIIFSSLGEYARKEKVKLVMKKDMIEKFNFLNKNFPLYYW